MAAVWTRWSAAHTMACCVSGLARPPALTKSSNTCALASQSEPTLLFTSPKPAQLRVTVFRWACSRRISGEMMGDQCRITVRLVTSPYGSDGAQGHEQPLCVQGH